MAFATAPTIKFMANRADQDEREKSIDVESCRPGGKNPCCVLVRESQDSLDMAKTFLHSLFSLHSFVCQKFDGWWVVSSK